MRMLSGDCKKLQEIKKISEDEVRFLLENSYGGHDCKINILYGFKTKFL